jgi:hypothetical protein
MTSLTAGHKVISPSSVTNCFDWQDCYACWHLLWFNYCMRLLRWGHVIDCNYYTKLIGDAQGTCNWKSAQISLDSLYICHMLEEFDNDFYLLFWVLICSFWFHQTLALHRARGVSSHVDWSDISFRSCRGSDIYFMKEWLRSKGDLELSTFLGRKSPGHGQDVFNVRSTIFEIALGGSLYVFLAEWRDFTG